MSKKTSLASELSKGHKASAGSRNISRRQRQRNIKKSATNIPNFKPKKRSSNTIPGVVAHAGLIKQVQVYQKEKRRNKATEEFIKQIQPYLNKDGTLNKHKVRSKKAKEEVNRILNEYKATGHTSRAKREKVVIEKQIETAERRGTYTRAERKGVVDLFKKKVVYEAHKHGYLSSDQIVELSRSKGSVTTAELSRIVKKFYDIKMFGTPEEAQRYATQDDFYGAIEADLLSLREEREGKEPLPFD